MERFYGTVSDGRLVLDARQAFIEAVRTLEGRQVVLELRQSRKRSNQQNRYYWGAVLPIVQYGMQQVGVTMSIEQVHGLMKFKHLQTEYVTTDGEIINSIGSTTARCRCSDILTPILLFCLCSHQTLSDSGRWYFRCC